MVNKFKLKQNYTSYSGTEEINPEVLKMLKELSEKKKFGINMNERPYDEAVPVKSQIILSDKEFGKY